MDVSADLMSPTRPRPVPLVEFRYGIAAEPLPDLLARTVAEFGDRPALDFLGRQLTWAQLGELVERCAAGLQALGVGRGVHVGLCLPNCPAYVIAYYGVLRAGGTVVNFNPLYAERELIQQIADSGTEILIGLDVAQLCARLEVALAGSDLKRLIVVRMAGQLPFAKGVLYNVLRRREVASRVRDDRHLGFDALLRLGGARPEPVTIDADSDLAVLQYTGGTTGVPKGAALTHANLTVNAQQIRAWFADAEPGRERFLGVLPFFHVFGMTCVMNFAALTAAEIVMLPRFDATEVMAAIARHKLSYAAAVPTIFNALLNHPHLKKYDLSSLRLCISGGAALPVEIKERFEGLTGCTVVEGYGLSETAPVLTCNPPQGVNKAGSIGLPLPGTTVEIVSLDDRVTVLPAGQKGEICARGPQVMTGYWHRPEATAEAMKGGRFHTGDVGYVDADGYVYLVDRLKEVVVCSGYNVYPRVVEEALYLHPDVVEAVVIGMPDPYRGQTVKACVVVRAGSDLDADRLRAFLADKISPIEMPKQFDFRSSLPKSAIGKILKRELIEEQRHKEVAA